MDETEPITNGTVNIPLYVCAPKYNTNKLLSKHARTKHRHMLSQMTGKMKDSEEYVNFCICRA